MSNISARTTTTQNDGSRLWVYPRDISGQYKRIHRFTSAFLHVFLFVVPWIRVGGYPAINIDVAGRKVWVLGQLFTASDGILLMLMGLFAAFALFFFTSLFGRLWCGYMCPHSVFLLNWVLPIERWIEGDRNKRRRRDRGAHDFDWAWRKAAKMVLFAGVSILLSMAFMGFFADPWLLWTGAEGWWDYGFVAFFAGLWFFDFAYFREQLCNFLCPYARFQGALMDDHSLVITYDVLQAEPRGGGKKAVEEGRCLDCNWCVEVCPQGIDIRDGFQLECIACGKCADACASVHEKAGGDSLIAYGTLADEKFTLVRPRTLIYATLMSVMIVAGLGFVAMRAPFEASVNRAPGTLFQVDADGQVRNTYIVRITNTSAETEKFQVAIEGLPDAELMLAPIQLGPQESRTVPLVVRMSPPADLKRTYPILVHVRDGEQHAVSRKATFKTPGKLVN